MTTDRLPEVLLNYKPRGYRNIGRPMARWEDAFPWSRKQACGIYPWNIRKFLRPLVQIPFKYACSLTHKISWNIVTDIEIFHFATLVPRWRNHLQLQLVNWFHAAVLPKPIWLFWVPKVSLTHFGSMFHLMVYQPWRKGLRPERGIQKSKTEKSEFYTIRTFIN
jgi:hypothetical protein